MNKSELIEKVANDAEISKPSANKVVSAVIDSITRSLQMGNPVTIVGFGTFLVRDRGARIGRNPRTGETLEIKASKVPAFKAGKALKDAINK